MPADGHRERTTTAEARAPAARRCSRTTDVDPQAEIPFGPADGRARRTASTLRAPASRPAADGKEPGAEEERTTLTFTPGGSPRAGLTLEASLDLPAPSDGVLS